MVGDGENEDSKNYRRLKDLERFSKKTLEKLFIRRSGYAHWRNNSKHSKNRRDREGQQLLAVLQRGVEQKQKKNPSVTIQHSQKELILNGKLSDWDTSLFILVLLNMPVELDLGGGDRNGGGVMRQNSQSRASIKQLAKLRNELAHTYFSSEKVPRDKFLVWWRIGKSALIDLDANPLEIDEIWKEPESEPRGRSEGRTNQQNKRSNSKSRRWSRKRRQGSNYARFDAPAVSGQRSNEEEDQESDETEGCCSIM